MAELVKNNVDGVEVILSEQESAAYLQMMENDLERCLAQEARCERGMLLAASDWTQTGDLPEEVKAPWRTYRQTLRDLPAQEDFPSAIVWPEEPA
jgi:hypothetical protein